MKEWKDAYIETRLNSVDNIVSIKAGNFDEIVLKTNLADKYERIYDMLYKLKERDEEKYKELREKWRERGIKDKKFPELVNLIYTILQSELLKYEKDISETVDNFEKILENELKKYGK